MAKKLALKVNEHNIGYLPISDAASPQAAAQGRKPSQNEAYFLRRERTPDDPAVVANRRFPSINGPMICRASARPRSNICRPWKRCGDGWRRSTPWRSICRPISSTHASPCRT
jgi:hypothetical protein